MMHSKRILVSASLFFAVFFCGIHASLAFDHSALDALLKKHVNESGEVNYQAIAQDPKPLDDYLAHLMTAGILERNSWPREETLAFWLNAYHATLIRLVVEHYPVTSVQRIPSFWDIALIHFGDGKSREQYSLNDIRKSRLMDVYRDEKIHLALSMAAKGGPKLMREAFSGPKVEGQLFLLTRQFVNNPDFVNIEPGRKKIQISKIFKWYGNDFKLDFGTPEPLGTFSVTDTAVLSFLAYYLEDEAQGEYLQEANYKIKYPAFDWSLNDQQG